jgi:hypothetical protein
MGTDINDDALSRRAQEVESAGKTKYGDRGWQDRIDALAGIGAGGAPLAEVIKQPNALDLLDFAARQAMLQQMSNGNIDAEAAYSKIREQERHDWRLARGRGPREG